LNEAIKVSNVEPLEGHWLRLSFSDGAVKDVDIGALLDAVKGQQESPLVSR
jgi:hypothetical protein